MSNSVLFPGNILHEAITHHQSGRISDAERLYNQILDAEPNNSSALHYLGLIYSQRGQLDEAISLIQKAISNDRRNAHIYSNLAITLNTVHRFEEAEIASRKAIEIDQEVESIFNSLGIALEGQGKLETAIKVYRKGLSIQPSDLNIYNNLGNLYARLGKFSEAVEHYKMLLKLDSNYDEAHAGLAKVYGETNNLKKAIYENEQALKINPNNMGCLNHLGLLALKKNNYSLAIKYFSKVLSVHPKHEEAMFNLAATYGSCGDLVNSLNVFEDYSLFFGQTPRYLNGVGITKLNFGFLNEAVEYFSAAIEKDPLYIEAYYNLDASPRNIFSDQQIKNIEKLFLTENISEEHLSKLNFIMGNINRKKGNTDIAFKYFETGNKYKQKVFMSHNSYFDISTHLNYIEKMKTYFSADFFKQKKDVGINTKLPVFIVGMPRSGTTLVQQIAATHSDIFGAGELTGISNLIDVLRSEKYPTVQYPEFLDNLNDSEISKVANKYLVFLLEKDNNAKRIIDKMPFNFLHLGFISLLFPKAKIIHCRRNILDIGVSCYFHNFIGDHPWSTDLACIGRYTASYIDIMKHWERVLPTPILNLSYEEMVQNQEVQTKRIIEFLELEWDQKCLNYFNTTNLVTTASSWQVREPVYSSSVNRWREYEKYLEPLLSELNE